ncbi:hypothetical protein Tco_0786258 [Tanacetum coccineum]
MSNLKFAETHNLVAFLEKPKESDGFKGIVGFLNSSSIRYALTVNPTIYTSCIKQFWATAKAKSVNEEVQIQALVDGKKVISTETSARKDFSGTVTPLFPSMLASQAVEGEGSGQPSEPQHTPTTASPSYSSGPTTLVADETVHEERGDSVERAATTTASLDAEQDSGTGSCSGPRRQDTILGDKPSQTRFKRLSERVLTLENIKTAQNLEIINLKKRVKKLEKKKKARTPQLKRRLFKVRIESSAKKSLGDQEDASKQGRNGIDQDEEISWFQEDVETQGSINITTAEPVTTASAPVTTAGVSVSTTEPSTPPTTTILIKMKISQLLEAHMQDEYEEEERVARQREEEDNLISWDNTQAMMEADYELAQRLQEKNIAEEIKRKPPTKAQKRNQMCTYSKNMANYKHSQLKNKIYKEIQMLFDNTMKWVDSFVPMDSEVVEGSKSQAEGSKKRTREELESDNSKKLKIDENVEVEVDDGAEMKKHMEIVPDDEVAIDAIPLATRSPIIVDWKIIKEGKMGYIQIIRADGSSRRYASMIRMLQNIDKEDLETLWKLVKAKHGNTRLEEAYERVLWGDLKNLHIFMLVEKKYSLTPATITEILNKKLQTDHWNEMCYQHLKLMTKQCKNPGSV